MIDIVTTSRSLAVSALLAAAMSLPSLPARSQAADDEASRRTELASLGWTADAAPEPAECSLLQPGLVAREAVWQLLHAPDLLPRPRLRCADGEALLPMAADAALLDRVETTAPPSATWRVQAQGQVRGLAAAALVDVAPFKPPPRAKSDSKDGAIAPGLQPRADAAAAPRVVWDPALRGRASKFNRFPEPVAAAIEPELVVVSTGDGLRDDALAVTADGKAWASISLTGEMATMRWSLGPGNVFGGSGRVLVAPRALLPEAESLLFAVDPATQAVTSLGRPAPRDAGRWLRVTDARAVDGVVEVLVVVDSLGPNGFSSDWGVLGRRAANGTWDFPERYFTPAPPGTWPVLRFDATDASLVRLVADGTRAWRHRGAATSAPAGPPQVSSPAP